MKAILATWLCLLGVGPLVPAAGAAPRPDVLVIFTDQWNPRYLSWENPQVITPHLDRIAREGLVFDACYTTSPVCMPARVSVVTGLYPHNQGHALWGNVSNYYLPPAAAPMFRDIQHAGYTTAQIGKLHWWSGAAWQKEFRSIDDYHRAMGLDTVISISGPPDSAGDHDPYCEHLKQLGLLEGLAHDMHERFLHDEYAARPSVVPPEEYHDTYVARLAADFIRGQPKDRPLCLVASFHSPHPPLDAPGKFATLFDPEKLTLPANVPEQFTYDRRARPQAEVRRMLANYLGKIALVDENFGRLIEAFEARGTWSNTLVAFVADHGEMLGAHGALSKGRFWEESARVPLVLRWPGHIRTGRTAALAQLFDIYPTIVEAIGGELSPGRFARSLLPVATGKAAAVRDLVISEIGKEPPLGLMARSERYKWWDAKGEEFLFDMQQDPLELQNLAGAAEHHAMLEQMRHRALTYLRLTQVNLAAGYKSKVQRVREAAEKEAGQAAKTPQKARP